MQNKHISEEDLRFQCEVKKVFYYNDDNGFAIFKAFSKEYSKTETFSAKGTFPGIVEGQHYEIVGEWKVDPQYGLNFIVKQQEELLPVSPSGIRGYLSSGLIKGVGKLTAAMIEKKFGRDTFRIMDEEPERLLEVTGIGKKKLEKIKKSWAEHREIKNVMVFLGEYGVSTTYAAKIYKRWGANSIRFVKENPYRLADEIWGIGFKIADRIAMNMGFQENGYARVRSGIMYSIHETCKTKGHVFLLHDELLKAARALLGEKVYTSDIEDAFTKMAEQFDIIVEDGAIYLPEYYEAEERVARKLKEMASFPDDGQRADVARIEGELGITYDDAQVEAIQMAVNRHLMVLTGGPGTGKSTVTSGIIEALDNGRNEIALAAPTGRAAKRMTEATGREAKTIHRLLEFKPDGKFERDRFNPLEEDVLIIDETSMIDIRLMDSLLQAIPTKMKVIFVGDVDQLPSVGPGTVLRDLIESKKIPVTCLTKIFRQAQSSRIVTNAHMINKGTLPDLSNGKTTDFVFMNRSDVMAQQETIKDLVTRRLPEHYHKTPMELAQSLQVLSPIKKGPIGTEELNRLLQDIMNPTDRMIQRGNTQYRLHDKVMQITNNYEKGVFNGDIGVITDVNTEDNELTVTFDGAQVVYEKDDMDELVLSYAITIHKSQGSEFPIVVMPVSSSHYIMLQRNLVYTGVTRAKKMCVIVGDEKGIGIGVRKFDAGKRNSRLVQRLQNA